MTIEIKDGIEGTSEEYRSNGADLRDLLIPVGAMTQTKPPPAPMLLRTEGGVDFLPQGKVCMIAAEGGKGKTALLVNLAISIATGRRFLSYCSPNDPAKVAMILGEEDRDDIHRRLWRSMDGMNLDEDEKGKLSANLYILPCVGQRNTRFAEDKERGNELKDALKQEGPWSLIIADPLSRFGGSEMETDNAQATDTIRFFEELLKLEGNPTVLLSHHVRKSNKEDKQTTIDDIRGSSALKDGARWAATIIENGKTDINLDESTQTRNALNKLEPKSMTLRILKANSVATGQEIKYEMKDGIVRSSEQNEYKAQRLGGRSWTRGPVG